MASYSGLYNNHYGESYSLLSSSDAKGNGYNGLSRMFARRTYDRGALGELIATLVAGAVGDRATKTHRRVKAERNLLENVQGGAREIEVYTDIDRDTTSADALRIVAALEQPTSPVYPVDRSGNGGGNKLGW